MNVGDRVISPYGSKGRVTRADADEVTITWDPRSGTSTVTWDRYNSDFVEQQQNGWRYLPAYPEALRVPEGM